tara:strand:+ start:166 stop:762 length:597 start_codon:yes stop_codon:yes gene_type:complete
MKLEIIYATTSGNAEMIAKKLLKMSQDQGFEAKMGEMNNYSIKKFSELENVAIITSTYGNGDVPEMGIEFWEDLEKTKIKLNGQKYGMIALGDRSHEIFCGGGKKISSKLDELGSKKIVEKLECDGDTEGSYEWSLNFLKVLKKQGSNELKMSSKKTCITCNNDTKVIANKLGDRDPRDIEFKEAKEIFTPLADKIKN